MSMLRVDMIELEDAFELRDHPFSYYLDTETGECVVVPGFAYEGEVEEEMETAMELIDSAPAGRFLHLDPEDVDVRPTIADAREFVRDIEDERLRRQLEKSLDQHRGAFRAFNDIIHGECRGST